MVFSAAKRLAITFAAQPSGLVNELKFVGDELWVHQATCLLDSFCLADSEYPVGYIHSIYFDTPDRSYLDEKIDGDNLKQKVRIRWYGRTGPTGEGDIPVFVEVKGRLGSARKKSRVTVPARERWINETPLTDPALVSFLYQHAGKTVESIPLNLVPVLCISYERLRYRCPQTDSRIALDRRIRAERVNATQFPSLSAVHLNRIVCEFKKSGKALPSWSDAFYDAGFRLRSFSKFGECMNLVLNGGTPV